MNLLNSIRLRVVERLSRDTSLFVSLVGVLGDIRNGIVLYTEVDSSVRYYGRRNKLHHI